MDAFHCIRKIVVAATTPSMGRYWTPPSTDCDTGIHACGLVIPIQL